jgi:cellobiose phosphorylase
MSFDGVEIRFRPVVPAGFSTLRLSGLTHRGLTLDLTITGSGNRIRSFTVDGATQPDHSIPATLRGSHRVDVTMA